MVDGPQLDADDIELIRNTRPDFMAGRKVPIDIVVKKIVGVDDLTDLPITSDVKVTVSGIVQGIEDNDRLLLQGGRVNVGDTKMVFFFDDVVPSIGIENLRRATFVHPSPSGIKYIYDVLLVEGLGGPSRIEIGLVFA